MHPPHIFQIDGNLGATSGIAEMLVQSHEENVIRLLPALPDDWKDGHMEGLKARGDFEIDIYWESGILTHANIIANRGGKVKVMYGIQMVQLDLKEKEIYSFLPN